MMASWQQSASIQSYAPGRRLWNFNSARARFPCCPSVRPSVRPLAGHALSHITVKTTPPRADPSRARACRQAGRHARRQSTIQCQSHANRPLCSNARVLSPVALSRISTPLWEPQDRCLADRRDGPAWGGGPLEPGQLKLFSRRACVRATGPHRATGGVQRTHPLCELHVEGALIGRSSMGPSLQSRSA